MISKEAIRNVLEDTDRLSGKSFAFAIQFLIVLSLVTFSIDTLPDLEQNTRDILRLAEVITVGIFTVEYLLRIAVSKEPMKYVLSFYGLVDLAAILPFYVAAGLDLRSVRVLRLPRLVRILKLLKYNQAIGGSTAP